MPAGLQLRFSIRFSTFIRIISEAPVFTSFLYILNSFFDAFSIHGDFSLTLTKRYYFCSVNVLTDFTISGNCTGERECRDCFFIVKSN